jgi:hypothetical protein
MPTAWGWGSAWCGRSDPRAGWYDLRAEPLPQVPPRPGAPYRAGKAWWSPGRIVRTARTHERLSRLLVYTSPSSM